MNTPKNVLKMKVNYFLRQESALRFCRLLYFLKFKQEWKY